MSGWTAAVLPQVLFIKSSGNRCCSSNQAETGVVHQIKRKQVLFIKSSGNRCCSSNQAETGVVHQIKWKVKNRYKYEVRCLRCRQLYITCRRIGSALSDARHRDFWKQVRLLRRNTCGGHCNHSSIDELSSNDDIASAFTSILKQLLNSSSNPSVSNRLSTELDSMIVSQTLHLSLSLLL